MSEKLVYTINDENMIHQIFGDLDKNKRIIENSFNVVMKINSEGIEIIGEKEKAEKTYELIEQLVRIIKKQPLTDQQLNYTIDSVLIGKGEELEKLLEEPISYTASGKILRAKTLGQYKYINAIKKNDIVFGIGPAGTGKTYLAMAMAIKAFKNNEVRRIILTRPAVEAGESLGFLPGDLQEKIDPYLRPLYDALFDILGFENYQRLVEKGLIEVAPLAYMRGRTLDDSYIILDEAQNTTSQQMKMFLTRIGYGSKAVITGDITQVDLPRGKKSGLVSASNILKDIKGIEFMTFKKEDVVRHPLVQRIIEAYEKDDK
ncbi:PhoH family protein [Gallicola sp. Sow4_E12]|uniref:PhoH family protein n=1 Tax=Gallicola sp. Sow4_E12 TaxID=3438785 RepID=UPI003F909734